MPHRPIAVLDPDIANRIAAGEVIERPASAVKELIENALDAGARRVEVEIRGGGKEYIRVTDDGHGIPAAEVPLAFERHATSKIAAADDLFAIATLGFRGEALPSIAAVAEVEMRTRTADQLEGVRYVIVAGQAKAVEPAGAPVGTTVIVRRLFFNTPARYKFLRTDTTEKRYVADVVARLAVARPDVAFRLLADGRELLSTPGDGDLLSAVAAVYGQALARELVPVTADAEGIRVGGLVGRPDVHHSSRERITVCLNGRSIAANALARAIEKGYDTLLPPRRFPVAVIHLTMDPRSVDVNVHPAKAEVRFRDDSLVFRIVLRAVRQGLLGANLVPGLGVASPVAASPDPPAPVRTAARESSLFGEAGARRDGYGVSSSWEPPDAVIAPTTAWPAGSGGRAAGDAWEQAARPRIEPPAHAPETGSRWDDDARRVLREMTVLGQLHRTYILGETPAGLWIVDQHVAHERILYEEFLRAAGEGSADVQQLLVPITVTLSPAHASLVESLGSQLAQVGLMVEPFGGRTYLVRGLPVALARSDAAHVQQLLEEVLDACSAEGGWQPHAVCARMACRAAVKAGQLLDERQMRQLVNELARAENPFACPHGRPIVIEVPRGELARRFGRH